MRCFSDCHFHAITLKDPDFLALLDSLYDAEGRELLSNLTSDYILTGKLFKDGNFRKTLSNVLTVFSRSIAESFLIMEKDLEGCFSDKRFIYAGKFHFRSQEYDKILMLPLVIDFSDNPMTQSHAYYRLSPKERLTVYADETIQGIRQYYESSPEGLFEFYPFLGINPAYHSMEYLVDILDKHINISHSAHPWHTVPDKPFYGIKLYPPLGFNPLPEDKEEQEKVFYLYEYCSYYKIPLVTHCDDQGFRGVQTGKAWEYTSPGTWGKVLERYPGLVIDFAHFGKQYALTSLAGPEGAARRIRRLPDSPWFYKILSLMEEYPGVYADLSFSGSERSFHRELYAALQERDSSELMKRILFGSDFPVSLFKSESYSSYFSTWESAPFSDEEVEEIANSNALRFLGLS